VLPLDNVLESAHSAPKIGHINVGRFCHSRIMPGHRRRRRAVTLGNGTYAAGRSGAGRVDIQTFGSDDDGGAEDAEWWVASHVEQDKIVANAKNDRLASTSSIRPRSPLPGS